MNYGQHMVCVGPMNKLNKLIQFFFFLVDNLFWELNIVQQAKMFLALVDLYRLIYNQIEICVREQKKRKQDALRHC